MRSQTSTEYLIITAVVIIIAVLVIGVLGGIPGIGSGDQEDISELALKTDSIGMNNYVSSSTNTTFWIQNNENEQVTVEGLWVDQKACATEYDTFPKTLRIGEELEVICYNIQSLSETPRVNIRYEEGSSAEFVTADNQNYKGTTSVDCWSDTPNTNGFYPICTCDDLNLTRTELARNYSLQNNIDFLDAHCTVYRQGSGWDPIGNFSVENYTGYFNGYDNVIENLYINRPNHDNVGLFGSGDIAPSPYIRITRLGLIDADVTGKDYVGILLGDASSATINHSFTTGSVSGTNDVGGLVGYGYSSDIENSYSASSVTGQGQVGGLSGGANFMESAGVFSRGTVTGNNNVGGLFGYAYQVDVNNSYSASQVSCTGTYCGGVSGSGGGAEVYDNVTWTNYTTDTVTGCMGRASDSNGIAVTGCTP